MFNRDAKSEKTGSLRDRLRHIESREWSLWITAILVTLMLTFGIISMSIPVLRSSIERPEVPAEHVLRGLVATVLLFDLYAIYQQTRLFKVRTQFLENQELFRLITENAEDMIAVVDAQGHRLYNSPSYQRILGYTSAELSSTSSIEQIHPDDREKVIKAAAAARKTGVGERVEYRMRHKNGTWRFFESTARTSLNKHGEVEKLVIVNRDVTERRLLEKQFLQAQKMEAVGRLSGGVAHDFNNLLGVIIGYAEVLQDEPEKALARESIEEILRAGRQASSLTKQLLAFSRQQFLEPKVLSIREVINNLEKMVRRLIGEDVILHLVLADDLGDIKVDQTQLEQAIMNLAVNARDAMPEGGDITLRAINCLISDQTAHEFPFVVTPGPYVCLSLTDDGVGMSPETQARIFEPFFTTKESGKGTGLGLAMVYGFVKQSGGYVDVSSELGGGTTMKIYLPRVDTIAKSARETSKPVGSLAGVETILLVEDEASLRQLIIRHLQSLGYKVLEASNASTAISLSDSYKDTIHLLMTDIVMPRINGRELAQILEYKRPEMHVLYMSGYTGQALDSSWDLAEGSFFIAKPFSRNDLAQKLKGALAPEVVAVEK